MKHNVPICCGMRGLSRELTQILYEIQAPLLEVFKGFLPRMADGVYIQSGVECLNATSMHAFLEIATEQHKQNYLRQKFGGDCSNPEDREGTRLSCYFSLSVLLFVSSQILKSLHKISGSSFALPP